MRRGAIPTGAMANGMTEAWIATALDGMRRKNLERSLTSYPDTGGKIKIDGREYLNLSSNDYLDLAHHPEVTLSAERALRTYGGGATASRLVTGNLSIYSELENALAEHKGYPSALVFGCGYMTNAGAISTLVDRHDQVFADRLVHASMIDAVTLSRAKLFRFRHNDAGHLEELLGKHPTNRRRLIVTESVFSMDGDLAPLEDIAAAARSFNAMLMVDEAHATGVFGPGGSGLIREHALESSVNVSMGTLGKALGCYGGFVACSTALRRLLIGRARSLIYSTALPPAVVGAAMGALEVLRTNPSMGEALLERARIFRDRLGDAGLDTMHSSSQIIPVVVGDNAKVLALSSALRDRGIIAAAMRPPTVPPQSSRLRLSMTLAHSQDDLERAAKTLIECVRKEGIA